MPITQAQATAKLKEWTSNPSLLNHARAVRLAMEAAAIKYGNPADSERWGIAGLLHDADYERWPDEHPKKIVEWLESQGEAEIAHAVAVHNLAMKVPAETAMDKALLACDELSGFVVACSLVRPDGISTLTAKSVKKKLKDKSFAAKVSREEIHEGTKLLGAELEAHIDFVIAALKPYAAELGITGTQHP